MTGRPSLYKLEHCEALIECLARGHSIEGFAGEIGVGRRTVYDWLDRHKEFAEAYEIAQSKSTLHWEKTLLEFAQLGKGNPALIIFGLCNRAKGAWVQKVVNEHTGKDGDDMKLVVTWKKSKDESDGPNG